MFANLDAKNHIHTFEIMHDTGIPTHSVIKMQMHSEIPDQQIRTVQFPKPFADMIDEVVHEDCNKQKEGDAQEPPVEPPLGSLNKSSLSTKTSSPTTSFFPPRNLRKIILSYFCNLLKRKYKTKAIRISHPTPSCSTKRRRPV